MSDCCVFWACENGVKLECTSPAFGLFLFVINNTTAGDVISVNYNNGVYEITYKDIIDDISTIGPNGSSLFSMEAEGKEASTVCPSFSSSAQSLAVTTSTKVMTVQGTSTFFSGNLIDCAYTSTDPLSLKDIAITLINDGSYLISSTSPVVSDINNTTAVAIFNTYKDNVNDLYALTSADGINWSHTLVLQNTLDSSNSKEVLPNVCVSTGGFISVPTPDSGIPMYINTTDSSASSWTYRGEIPLTFNGDYWSRTKRKGKMYFDKYFLFFADGDTNGNKYIIYDIETMTFVKMFEVSAGLGYVYETSASFAYDEETGLLFSLYAYDGGSSVESSKRAKKLLFVSKDLGDTWAFYENFYSSDYYLKYLSNTYEANRSVRIENKQNMLVNDGYLTIIGNINSKKTSGDDWITHPIVAQLKTSEVSTAALCTAENFMLETAKLLTKTVDCINPDVIYTADPLCNTTYYEFPVGNTCDGIDTIAVVFTPTVDTALQVCNRVWLINRFVWLCGSIVDIPKNTGSYNEVTSSQSRQFRLTPGIADPIDPLVIIPSDEHGTVDVNVRYTVGT